MKRLLAVMLTCFCFGISLVAGAQGLIFQVPRDFTDINDAIAAVGNNGKVVLSAGVYNSDTQTFPIVITQHVILEGAGKYKTVIDGTGVSGPLVIVDGMASNLYGLFDFTVRNTNNTTGDGAGVVIRNSPFTTIQGLHIAGNTASGGAGGGMLIEDSSPTLKDIDFIDNSAQNGGGLSITGTTSTVTLDNCLFLQNEATAANGGALLIQGDAAVDLNNCEFRLNIAAIAGGGVFATSSSGAAIVQESTVSNSQIIANAAPSGGAVASDEGSVNFTDCEILDNVGITGSAGYSFPDSILNFDRCRISRNESNEHVLYYRGEGDISNSFFYRNRTTDGSGLQVQGAFADVRAVGNTFAQNRISGGILEAAVNQRSGIFLFQNNIVANNDGMGFAETTFTSDPVFHYNCLYGNIEGNYLDEGFAILNNSIQFSVVSNPVTPVGVIFVDPLFRDEGVNNFHLAAGSPVIGGASLVPGIPIEDIDQENRTVYAAGSAPDIGADEQLAPILTLDPLFYDKDLSGYASEGDELVLQFSEPMTITAPLIESDFLLPVSGDSLGTGFTAVVTPDNPKLVRIVLGVDPVLTEPGTFNSGSLAPASPSGLEISPSIRLGVLLASRTNLDAVPFVSGGRDVAVTFIVNTVNYPNDNLPVTLSAAAGGIFSNMRVEFPAGSLLQGASFQIIPTFEHYGVNSAMFVRVVTGAAVIDPSIPARVVMEFSPDELNTEGPNYKERLRIFVLRQNIFGSYVFQPVEDSLGGVQQIDYENNTISVNVDELIPQDINFKNPFGDNYEIETSLSVNQLATYIVAPLEVMEENVSETISKVFASSADELASLQTALALGRVFIPTLSSIDLGPTVPFDMQSEVYYYHHLKVNDYDPDPLSTLGVLMQPSANAFERNDFQRCGIPESNFTPLEILTWMNGDPNVQSEFLNEIDLRLQYKNDAQHDLIDELGYPAAPKQLEFMQYDPDWGFIPVNATSITNVVQSSWIEASGIQYPTPGGRGIFALIADATNAFQYTFDLGEEGWQHQAAPLYFTAPEYISGYGQLGLGSNGLNTFGSWVTPPNAITVVPDMILVAHYNMTTNLSNTDLMPSLRFRLNAENGQSAATIQLNSDGYGTAIPNLLETQTYTVIFDPPRTALDEVADKDGVSAGFDIMHFDPNNAPYAMGFLNDFSLQQIDKREFDKSFSTEKTYDFNFNTQGWGFVPAVGDTTPALGSYDSVTRSLTLQAQDSQTFGFWTADSKVTLTPGRLYRVTFNVSSTEPFYTPGVPMFRLRVSDGITYNQVLEIASTGNGQMSPMTLQQPYEVYFQPPTEVAETERPLILGFDITNFNPEDFTYITLRLHSVKIESRPSL